jgi:hypothetical protein
LNETWNAIWQVLDPFPTHEPSGMLVSAFTTVIVVITLITLSQELILALRAGAVLRLVRRARSFADAAALRQFADEAARVCPPLGPAVSRLVDSVFEHDGRLFSKVHATDLFTPEQIRSPRGLALVSETVLASMPGVLTGIGIFGTFVGLVKGLGDYKIALDQADFEQGIRVLIAGLSVSFRTSVWGLLSSLLVTLFGRWSAGRADVATDRLAAAVDAALPYGEPLLAAHANSTNRLETAILTMGERLSADFTQAVHEVMAPTLMEIAALSRASSDGTKAFVSQSTEEHLTGVGNILQQVLTGVDAHLAEHLSGAATALHLVMEDHATNATRFAEATGAMEGLVTRVEAAGEQIGIASSALARDSQPVGDAAAGVLAAGNQLEALAPRLEALADRSEGFGDNLTLALATMAAASERHEQAEAALTKATEALASLQARTVETATSGVTAAVSTAIEEARSSLNTLAEHLGGAASALHVVMEGNAENATRFTTATSAMEGLVSRVEAAGEQIGTASSALARDSQPVGDAAAGVLAAGNQLEALAPRLEALAQRSEGFTDNLTLALTTMGAAATRHERAEAGLTKATEALAMLQAKTVETATSGVTAAVSTALEQARAALGDLAKEQQAAAVEMSAATAAMTAWSKSTTVSSRGMAALGASASKSAERLETASEHMAAHAAAAERFVPAQTEAAERLSTMTETLERTIPQLADAAQHTETAHTKLAAAITALGQGAETHRETAESVRDTVGSLHAAHRQLAEQVAVRLVTVAERLDAGAARIADVTGPTTDAARQVSESAIGLATASESLRQASEANTALSTQQQAANADLTELVRVIGVSQTEHVAQLSELRATIGELDRVLPEASERLQAVGKGLAEATRSASSVMQRLAEVAGPTATAAEQVEASASQLATTQNALTELFGTLDRSRTRADEAAAALAGRQLTASEGLSKLLEALQISQSTQVGQLDALRETMGVIDKVIPAASQSMLDAGEQLAAASQSASAVVDNLSGAAEDQRHVLSSLHTDETRRQADVAGLIRELARWIRSDGLETPPDQHALLAEQPSGMLLSLSGIADCSWSTLFIGSGTSSKGALWLRWTDKEGLKGAFLPPAVSWPLHALVAQLLERLHGDEVEFAQTDTAWVHPAGWWDDWKPRPLTAAHETVEAGRHETTIGDIYRDALYPTVEATLEAMILADSPCRRVVDVCAGDGELALRLLKRWPALQLTLLECNAQAVAASRERIGDRAVVREEDVRTATWPVEADVVLLVGAIQGNVMSSDDAYAAIRQAYASLRPGGLAIVTGYSPCLVDAGGFELVGFNVLNRAAPPTHDNAMGRQHYVLRRPT